MRVPVLLVGGGAPWEPRALEVIDAASSRLVLVKRCMDLTDLLADATTGSASVAVVGAGVVGLDVEVVARLQRAGVSVVVVDDVGSSAVRERLTRLGLDRYVAVADLDSLPSLVEGAAPKVEPRADPGTPVVDSSAGVCVAVWGPTGAPGRTTVAVGLAADLADRGRATLLLDADPYGGVVAQHLGVLDQVSGLLAAARLANAGELDDVRLAATARRVHDRLRVLTGLPRPDRWVEVRASAFEMVLATAAALDPTVVVDTGFCLETDPDVARTATSRNTMTVTALERADHVVVVGSADPVGLTRLVRGLHDLRDLLPGAVPTVVVNRMRGSLGWSERDLVRTVAEVARSARVVFVPEDRTAADRAQMTGRSLTEGGDSPLRRGIAALADVVLEVVDPAGAGQLVSSR